MSAELRQRIRKAVEPLVALQQSATTLQEQVKVAMSQEAAECRAVASPDRLLELLDELDLAASILDSEPMMWLMCGGDPQWTHSHLDDIRPAWTAWRIATNGGEE